MLGNVACFFLPAVFDKIFQDYTITDSYSLDPNHVPQSYAQLPLCRMHQGGGGRVPSLFLLRRPSIYCLHPPLNINIRNIMHSVSFP